MAWKVPSQMPSRLLLHHGHHAAFHLAGGLVGEGDGDDVVCRHALALDQVRQAAGEHARLAGAGSGQHQGLPVTGGDSRRCCGFRSSSKESGMGYLASLGGSRRKS